MPNGFSVQTNNTEKIDWLAKFGLKGLTPPTVSAPKVELNGNGNWGKTDGFVKSSSTPANTQANKPVQAAGSAGTPVRATGNSDTAEEIEAGNAALSSRDKAVVTAARDGVANLESSPDSAAPVQAALSAADAAEGVVTSKQQAQASAVAGQNEAKGVKDTAKTDKEQKAETVKNQKQDVKTKESNLKKAESAVTAAKSKVSSAEASVSSAQSALASAQSGLPYSAAAVAAAQAALQTAQAQLAEAKAELAKAEAEKEVAQAQLEESKAKLTNDEQALKTAETKLKEAETKLEKANQEVTKAKEAVTKAKADLSEKKSAYEAVKNDTKQVSSDVRSKLDKTLKDIEAGEQSSESASAPSKWQKASAISEGALKIGNSVMGLFANQNSQADSSTSTKRKMTAEESAQLDKTLASVGNFINNGGAQITNTGESILDASTRAQNSADNPFLKKPLDA